MKTHSLILVLIFGSTLAFHSVAANSADKGEGVKKTEVVNENPAMITLKPFVSDESASTESVSYFSDYAQARYEFRTPGHSPKKRLRSLTTMFPLSLGQKKSAAIEELKVVLSINEFGKLTGFRILNEGADKGLKERMGHVLRKLPAAVPVPGFQTYEPMEFQLVMAY